MNLIHLPTLTGINLMFKIRSSGEQNPRLCAEFQDNICLVQTHCELDELCDKVVLKLGHISKHMEEVVVSIMVFEPYLMVNDRLVRITSAEFTDIDSLYEHAVEYYKFTRSMRPESVSLLSVMLFGNSIKMDVIYDSPKDRNGCSLLA